MIYRPKEHDQIDMVLRDLQSRFARNFVGIPIQDLKSLARVAFTVEEAIARGLWTDTAPPPNSKGKKLVGSSNRFGEVDTISYQYQRPTHHSLYRLSIIRAHFSHPQYQYQPIYVQQPYITQTSLQPWPPYPRATTPPPLDHMHRGPARQFALLGMTLTRAFEKLKDTGVIVHLAPHPLPYPIPPYFQLHEHCLYY